MSSRPAGRDKKMQDTLCKIEGYKRQWNEAKTWDQTKQSRILIDLRWRLIKASSVGLLVRTIPGEDTVMIYKNHGHTMLPSWLVVV